MGLGKSGRAAALVSGSTRRTRHRLRLASSRPNSADDPALLDKGIAVETGVHGERTFRDQDLIVVSPGVPVDAPQSARRPRQLGIRSSAKWNWLRATYRARSSPSRGSNGKTTTTTLAGEVLAARGKEALVGGNIGTPVD